MTYLLLLLFNAICLVFGGFVFYKFFVQFLFKKKKISKFRVVGITGFKRNGKDTVANHIYNSYKGFAKIAFADSLKEICATLFSFNHEQLHGSLKEIPDPEWFDLQPRRALQYIGTDMFRAHMHELCPEIGENFWVLCAEKRIYRLFRDDQNIHIVISDVRFPNECQMIKDIGGTIIRVTRPEANTSADLHESERSIPTLPVDFDVINDGSFADLYKKIDDALEHR